MNHNLLEDDPDWGSTPIGDEKTPFVEPESPIRR
jgi:hypothetical protein